jgi:hypothetical protein
MVPLPLVMLLPPFTSTPCEPAKVDEGWRRATPCTVTLPLVVDSVEATRPSVMTTPLFQSAELPRMSMAPVELAICTPASVTLPPAICTAPPAPASLWPTRVSICESTSVT